MSEWASWSLIKEWSERVSRLWVSERSAIEEHVGRERGRVGCVWCVHTRRSCR